MLPCIFGSVLTAVNVFIYSYFICTPTNFFKNYCSNTLSISETNTPLTIEQNIPISKKALYTSIDFSSHTTTTSFHIYTTPTPTFPAEVNFNHHHSKEDLELSQQEEIRDIMKKEEVDFFLQLYRQRDLLEKRELKKRQLHFGLGVIFYFVFRLSFTSIFTFFAETLGRCFSNYDLTHTSGLVISTLLLITMTFTLVIFILLLFFLHIFFLLIFHDSLVDL